MKQILQDLGSGKTYLEDSPVPRVSAGKLLIQTTTSLISAGTERMLVDFGRSSLVQKARQQPEKVKQVLEKVATDGLLVAMDAVKSKLSQPLSLGYCNVGRVLGAVQGIEGFKPGDRVVSNGPHAEVVNVPKNLCALIPDAVDDESAAFTVVASIGLQGIRLASPTLGESFVVTGAGLIGLLTVQLLRAHGCRVLAIDFDDSKLEMARRFGAETCNPAKGEDPLSAGYAFSRGQGVDGVIITASTASSDPVTQAARMCRRRGRIVLVGVTGLELNRADFYEKELSFQVSCSYGPGRYDSAYEEMGQDYPLGFVRWSEQRNFVAVLDMMADGRLDVKPLISRRIAFDDAPQAYDALLEDRSALGILLLYGTRQEPALVSEVALSPSLGFKPEAPICGFIGAGNYASRMLIPAFKKAGAQLHTIVTASGINGVIHGRKSGFAIASTDIDGMLAKSEINAAVIVTRHNTHAGFTAKALAAGKHVFVEKPLALDSGQLSNIRNAYAAATDTGQARHLMVGFNRRFAPQVVKMKQLLSSVREPKSFIMTMNAGFIPADHWTQDPAVGGGRIIGEACHFIDLMRFLAASRIVSVQARRMGGSHSEDKASIVLGFEDGSFGTIHYLANGSSRFPKERIEVFVAGRVLQLDNFRKLTGYSWPGFRKMNLWRQDKGQLACAKAFLDAIRKGLPSPIPVEELFEVAQATIDAAELIRSQ